MPEESHGQRSLEGYTPWGRKESDATEVTEQAHMHLGFAEDSFFKKPWVLISVTYVAKNNPGRRITINSVCNKLKNRRKKQHGFEKKKKFGQDTILY